MILDIYIYRLFFFNLNFFKCKYMIVIHNTYLLIT